MVRPTFRKALFVKVRNDIIGISYELKAVLGPVPEPSDEEKAKEDWYGLDVNEKD